MNKKIEKCLFNKKIEKCWIHRVESRLFVPTICVGTTHARAYTQCQTRFQHNSCLILSCDPIVILNTNKHQKISTTFAFFVLSMKSNLNKHQQIYNLNSTQRRHKSIAQTLALERLIAIISCFVFIGLMKWASLERNWIMSSANALEVRESDIRSKLDNRVLGRCKERGEANIIDSALTSRIFRMWNKKEMEMCKQILEHITQTSTWLLWGGFSEPV